MKRNGGIINKNKTSINNLTAVGVWDTHDQFTNSIIWPKPPRIDSVSYTGDVGGATSADEKVLWGHNGASKFNFVYTGENLSGKTFDIVWSNTSFNGSNTDGGALTQTAVSPDSDTQLTYTNGLTVKTFSVSGDSSVTVSVRLNGSSTDLFTHTIEIASYNVRMVVDHPRNEGDQVYATFYLDGTTSLVDTAVDVRFYNNWTDADFYTDTTPTDYNGTFYQGGGYYSTIYYAYFGIIREDMINEATETFTVTPRSYGGTLGYSYFTLQNTGAGYNQFTIADTSRNFTVSVSDTTPNEGDTLTLSCEVEDSPGEGVRWELYSGTASIGDISSASGTFNMSNGVNGNNKYFYDLNITISRDFLTEGNETMTFRFYNQDTDALLATSQTITIQDTTTLGSVSQTATSINEGQSVTFTINVNGAQSGVNYTHYWQTVGLTSGSGFAAIGSDFSDGLTTGSFTINGSTGSGTVTRTMANDGFTEGTETWKLQVSNTASGPWVDAGTTVTVNDTSTGSTETIPGIGGDIGNILSAVSGLTSSTNYATIISAINGAGRGYKVVATPRRGAMAESMTGVNGASALSTSGTGHFDYAAWDNSSDYLELSSGFGNNTLNGYPYMGFVMFNSSGPYGVAIMLFRDYTSSTTLLKNLWYPNQDRELYTYVLNSDSSTVIDTSGNTSTIFSDNQQPNTNGYRNTGRFAQDDGSWGFVNGTTRLDGNGGPYHSQSPSNAYGPPANQNAGDSSQAQHYWGASYNTSTTTDTAPVGGAYFFIKYS